jgi:ATP-dependent RNA helicase RhlE
MSRALVFTRTKRGADRVAKYLDGSGVKVSAIHGNKSQNQREAALAAFKAGRIRALVATDIAARGIDIDEVSHVINYELPNIPEAYVHRIGRTARAGAEGIAISLCDAEERAYLRDIEKLIRQSIPSSNRSGDASLVVDERYTSGGSRDTADSPRRGRSDRGGRSQGQPSGKRAPRRKYEDRSQAADARSGGGGRSAPVAAGKSPAAGGEEKRNVPSWGKPATPQQQPRNRNKRRGPSNGSAVVASGSWQPRSGGQKNGHRHQPSR